MGAPPSWMTLPAQAVVSGPASTVGKARTSINTLSSAVHPTLSVTCRMKVVVEEGKASGPAIPASLNSEAGDHW